ncbi:MAG: Redox-sensitive transcriptional activator SoxR, partial [uncultured Solirubrobacteraceae bacterium]
GRAADDRGGRAAQRRGGVRAALLRGAWPDLLGARGLRPPSLPPSGAAADRVHRVRPAGRHEPRRDRRRARAAALRPRSRPARVGAAVARVGGSHRRADRRARAAQGRPDRVHRLRLPVARPLPARQSRGPRRPAGRGPALLDGRPV